MLLTLNIFGKGVGVNMFPLWLYLLHCRGQKLATRGFLCPILSERSTTNKKKPFFVLMTLSLLQVI